MNFTNNVFLNVLLTVLYVLAVIILFNLAHIFYLKKFRIHKWVMLGVALGTFALTFILILYFPKGLWHLIPLTISLSAIMWFLDLRRRGHTLSRKAGKQIVNKPKPNPRRAQSGGATAGQSPATTPKAKPGKKK